MLKPLTNDLRILSFPLLRYNLRSIHNCFGVILIAGHTDFLIDRKNNEIVGGHVYGSGFSSHNEFFYPGSFRVEVGSTRKSTPPFLNTW